MRSKMEDTSVKFCNRFSNAPLVARWSSTARMPSGERLRAMAGLPHGGFICASSTTSSCCSRCARAYASSNSPHVASCRARVSALGCRLNKRQRKYKRMEQITNSETKKRNPARISSPEALQPRPIHFMYTTGLRKEGREAELPRELKGGGHVCGVVTDFFRSYNNNATFFSDSISNHDALPSTHSLCKPCWHMCIHL